ncbi:hypothetical protein HDA45_007526 [Amycolatopsis umgeniensis]|uniref:Uncharacterized protein n=1 Tax=Amycolatopsis umgeniensis TaxID=336628 RepID=A0A841B962_9PSEU|nr:hypothetical protein [Amycolatopsis umgeniensis]MBB5857439.1 hypothetical protein [Amycolatopsis umgeniensis]
MSLVPLQRHHSVDERFGEHFDRKKLFGFAASRGTDRTCERVSEVELVGAAKAVDGAERSEHWHSFTAGARSGLELVETRHRQPRLAGIEEDDHLPWASFYPFEQGEELVYRQVGMDFAFLAVVGCEDELTLTQFSCVPGVVDDQ